jgi:hypothetical protein
VGKFKLFLPYLAINKKPCRTLPVTTGLSDNDIFCCYRNVGKAVSLGRHSFNSPLPSWLGGLAQIGA